MAEPLPVVIMADDPYLPWARPFLHSLRDHAPDARVLCIPYSDALTETRALLRDCGAELIEADFAAIDAFAAEFFPHRPDRRRNLRKLIAFDLPAAPFLYMDCDQLVTGPLPQALARLAEAPAELVWFAASPDYVFAPAARAEMEARFPGQPLISTGNIALPRPVMGSVAILALIRAEAALYQRVRHPDVVDQPLLNLVARLWGWRLLPAHQALPGLTGEGFFRDPLLRLGADGAVTREGRAVLAVHFAGVEKLGIPAALLPLARRYGLSGAAA